MSDILETAKVLEQNGDYVAALEQYRQVYVQNTANEEAILGIAQCALALDNQELAFEFYVKLLIQNHENPWGYLGRANVLFRCGQADRALSDLAKAIRLDTPPSDLRIDIAAVLNANGYCDAALDVLHPIRKSLFDNTDFKCEWCFALLVQNKLNAPDLEPILAYFRQHIETDPFYELCLIAYELKTQASETKDKLSTFLEANPDLIPEAELLHLQL